MTNIYKHIASTLKALRQERGWSLDKAAEKTGVSKAMLGQIEREESSPTIATLWKIAGGFDTSFSSFMEDLDVNYHQVIHRTGKAEVIHPKDKGIYVMSLFPFDEKLKFEMFLIELLSGCEHLSQSHQSGIIEHVVVVEGGMEVFVDGDWKNLNKGEGLRFNANQPHGYRNFSSKKACFHDIIHY